MSKNTKRAPDQPARTRFGRCNHRSALLLDPTDKELRQLEMMLASCPNCSQWIPGDGPIMAVITTHPSEFLQKRKNAVIELPSHRSVLDGSKKGADPQNGISSEELTEAMDRVWLRTWNKTGTFF